MAHRQSIALFDERGDELEADRSRTLLAMMFLEGKRRPEAIQLLLQIRSEASVEARRWISRLDKQTQDELAKARAARRERAIAAYEKENSTQNPQ